ncbi:hypothetical protein FHS88_000335 [Roseomonas alkaliterrae]|uniref:Uncharacterized protein n=1 Tax=Neoroseomonas alkaliterrae TaxID=1452450 RepID=A0A840XI87_9PROT|nr:hypothetical protein [Neoroseomonas alkaliterrae]
MPLKAARRPAPVAPARRRACFAHACAGIRIRPVGPAHPGGAAIRAA